MRTLYHHTLLPTARKVRLALHEKRLEFTEVELDPWTPSEELLALNPSGEVPVLVDENEQIVCDTQAICEYLEETYPQTNLLGRTPKDRAEARRLAAWFDQKFFRDVTQHLAGEKLSKRVATNAAPDSRALRAGRENIHTHMQYIAWLTERRSWLAGDDISYADLSAAAHLSLIDYSGDVPWGNHPLTKEWYVRIKSRFSFRCLLSDTVQGIAPAPAYADLDF